MENVKCIEEVEHLIGRKLTSSESKSAQFFCNEYGDPTVVESALLEEYISAVAKELAPLTGEELSMVRNMFYEGKLKSGQAVIKIRKLRARPTPPSSSGSNPSP